MLKANELKAGKFYFPLDYDSIYIRRGKNYVPGQFYSKLGMNWFLCLENSVTDLFDWYWIKIMSRNRIGYLYLHTNGPMALGFIEL